MPGDWPARTPLVVSSHDYQITDLGSQLTLRTFCHENGHMVCDFPDLYDYDDVNVGYGVGHYSLMCYGGSDTNPVQVDAYPQARGRLGFSGDHTWQRHDGNGGGRKERLSHSCQERGRVLHH